MNFPVSCYLKQPNINVLFRVHVKGLRAAIFHLAMELDKLMFGILTLILPIMKFEKIWQGICMLACFPGTNLSLFLPHTNVSQPSSSVTEDGIPKRGLRSCQKPCGMWEGAGSPWRSKRLGLWFLASIKRGTAVICDLEEWWTFHLASSRA